jgi:hypothetical protein
LGSAGTPYTTTAPVGTINLLGNVLVVSSIEVKVGNFNILGGNINNGGTINFYSKLTWFSGRIKAIDFGMDPNAGYVKIQQGAIANLGFPINLGTSYNLKLDLDGGSLVNYGTINVFPCKFYMVNGVTITNVGSFL